MNVEELKQEARAFEQQGETEAALELYEKILTELEGTPEIWRELPLYVKTGDLSLKLNDASNAIAHYEKAANAYAAYGSSKSVIALCTKILRVNPGRTHVFLRLVRLMIEREHLADARLVLLEYSERLKLPKAGLVLAELADTSDEEMKPLLEMLLELGGRYEYARAQGRDHTSEDDVGDEEPEVEADEVETEEGASADSDGEATLSLAAAEQIERDRPRHAEDDEAEEQIGESDSETESDLAVEETKTDDAELASESATTEESDVQWVADRQSMQTLSPRSSRQVLFREPEERGSKPKALWIGLGVAAVLVVGGLSLVLFGVISFGGDGETGGGDQPLPFASPSDSALMAGVDIEDSTGTEGNTAAAAANDSTVGETEDVPISEERQTATEASDSNVIIPAIDSVQSAMPVASDTLAGGPPEELVDLVAEQAPPVTPPSQGVMVHDFDIETNTEFVVDGRIAYRITQILGTGELLTLSAVYYGEDIATAPGTEEMTLAPLVGDTTTAIMHFNGYAVEARAIVSASVLETLLGRLIEVPRSN